VSLFNSCDCTQRSLFNAYDCTQKSLFNAHDCTQKPCFQKSLTAHKKESRPSTTPGISLHHHAMFSTSAPSYQYQELSFTARVVQHPTNIKNCSAQCVSCSILPISRTVLHRACRAPAYQYQELFFTARVVHLPTDIKSCSSQRVWCTCLPISRAVLHSACGF
jgi:hypothetical protein